MFHYYVHAKNNNPIIFCVPQKFYMYIIENT